MADHPSNTMLPLDLLRQVDALCAQSDALGGQLAYSGECYSDRVDGALTVEDLDLDTFKSGLGSAPPAKFNGEGVLRERWADAYRLELEQQLPAVTERRTERIVAGWEAERRRRRRAAVLTAALMLLAYTAAAFWWSRTDWQRQLESIAPAQSQIKSMVPPYPWTEGHNQLSPSRIKTTVPPLPRMNGD